MVSQIPNIPSFLEERRDTNDHSNANENDNSLEKAQAYIEELDIQTLIKNEIHKVTLNLKNVLSFDECMEYTGLSRSYLYKLTYARQIPYCKPCGKKIYFSRKEVDNWLLSNRVLTTDEVQSFTKGKVDQLNRELRSK